MEHLGYIYRPTPLNINIILNPQMKGVHLVDFYGKSVGEYTMALSILWVTCQTPSRW